MVCKENLCTVTTSSASQVPVDTYVVGGAIVTHVLLCLHFALWENKVCLHFTTCDFAFIEYPGSTHVTKIF